jgi:hypothetical protein
MNVVNTQPATTIATMATAASGQLVIIGYDCWFICMVCIKGISVICLVGNQGLKERFVFWKSLQTNSYCGIAAKNYALTYCYDIGHNQRNINE